MTPYRVSAAPVALALAFCALSCSARSAAVGTRTGCAVAPQGNHSELGTQRAAQADQRPQGDPPVADSKPDRIFATADSSSQAELREAVRSYEQQARATYPTARDRFLHGLPSGSQFFVTVWLRDREGHEENSFVRVSQIRGTRASGRIASTLGLVADCHEGDWIELEESDVVDWTIVTAEGREEGNYVGKYFDSLQARLDQLPGEQEP